MENYGVQTNQLFQQAGRMTTSSQSAEAPNKHSVCLPRSESPYLDQRPQKLKTRCIPSTLRRLSIRDYKRL